MDLFGSERDSDDETIDQAGYAAEYQGIWIELMKIKPASKKRMINSLVELDTTEILLHRSIAIISNSPNGQELPSSFQAFLEKLRVSSFTFLVLMRPSELCTKHDIVVLSPSPASFSENDMRSIDNAVIAGGSLLACGGSAVGLEAGLTSLSSLWYTSSVPLPPSTPIMRYRKRCVDCNTLGATYWGAAGQSDELDQERELIELISVPLSLAEQDLQVLSDESHKRAVAALQQHGLCILSGLFPSDVVLKNGGAAKADMSQIIHRLETKGIDLLHPLRAQPRIENYHEMSMREALRCDIRNGNEMVKFASMAADEPRWALGGHPGVAQVLLEVMNPAGNPETSKGNWGRWNFEGGGPEGKPPPLKVGTVGAVMSLPGCLDQTIHADTAHIYVHTQLPGHYYNLFLPAVSDEDGSSSLLVGQTAFVAGSHVLATSAKIMTQAGGQTELNKRLVRPHLSAGDGLIFDCRILHFGLGNKSARIEGFEEADVQRPLSTNAENFGKNTAASDTWPCSQSAAGPAIRPLLYVNYHQAWFNDPKNWNDAERLFEEWS